MVIYTISYIKETLLSGKNSFLSKNLIQDTDPKFELRIRILQMIPDPDPANNSKSDRIPQTAY